MPPNLPQNELSDLCKRHYVFKLPDNGSSVSGKNISEFGIILEILGSIWPFFYYIINKKWNDFMERRSPLWYKTSLISNTCISIVNIMWEWGLVSRGGGTMLYRQKTESVTYWLLLFYIKSRVPWQFLCTFLHKRWQILLILSKCNLYFQGIAHFYKF